jgi:hypothetical protein
VFTREENMPNVPKPINWEFVKECLKKDMGAPAIAAKMPGVSQDMLYARAEAETGSKFTELRASMMEVGTDELKETGFDMAIKGNIQMLILFLKNRAGFADHVKVDGDLPESMIGHYKAAIDASNKAVKKVLKSTENK